MYLEEIGICNKLLESDKATILGNTQPYRQPSTYVNFYDVTLGNIIKYIYHQFDFCDTNNEPSNVDLNRKDNSTYGSGN